MNRRKKPTETKTTHDDQVPDHLADFYDLPADEDALLTAYTDRLREQDWHNETTLEAERDRRVAAGELPPDMPWTQAKARIKATGFVVPPLTAEDRQGYRHAVRLAYAQQRHEDAERGRQVEEARAATEQCATGHRDATTAQRMINGTISVRLCNGCATVAEHTVAAIYAAETIDGQPRGDRVRVWLASVEDQLHTIDPLASIAWTAGYARAMADGRITR